MTIKTTHQLAAELLKCENTPFDVSIDISSSDDDAHLRAFGFECLGINDRHASVITILFEGNINDDS